MPTFDVVSEVDMQEVRNAVDQASRELATRFDFKGTESTVELNDKTSTIDLGSASEERLKAVSQVLEEKLVKRKVSLKILDYGKIEEGAKGHVRQSASLSVGISDVKAKEIGKFIKELGLKGVNHQIQGKQLRVQGKKRDDLQAAIAAMRDHDFGIPLQFENFRD
jgi:cyclic-di-GMP-binding protein